MDGVQNLSAVARRRLQAASSTTPGSRGIDVPVAEKSEGEVQEKEDVEEGRDAKRRKMAVVPRHRGKNWKNAKAQAGSGDVEGNVAAPVNNSPTLTPGCLLADNSVFKPSGKDGILEFTFETSRRLVVLGQFGLLVHQGAVTVGGATFYPGDPMVDIMLPRCHAVPSLRSTDDTRFELHPSAIGVDVVAMGRISPLYQRLWHDDIEFNGDSGHESLETATYRVLCEHHLPRKEPPLNGTSLELPALRIKRAKKPVVIQELFGLPMWNKKLAELVEQSYDRPPTVLVCGPKASGKSTFVRLLINRLLTQEARRRLRSPPWWETTALLDLDPGQPETSPPGFLSLVRFTAPLTQPRFALPYASTRITHALAEVSPAPNPQLYMECALDLQMRQRSTELREPLIINTPGWIQGTGLQNIIQLIEKIQPDEVIYMSENGPTETVEVLLAACAGRCAFSALPSQLSDDRDRTAADLRNMQTMAYFHQSEGSETGAPLWEPRPLINSPPWAVRYKVGDSDGPAGFLALLCMHQQPSAQFIGEFIVGNVLALVEIEDVAAFRGLVPYRAASSSPDDTDENSFLPTAPINFDFDIAYTPEGIPFIDNQALTSRGLDPRHSNTLGLVLVRDIIPEERILHLSTPISKEVLAESWNHGRRLVLVAGRFGVPSWALTEHLYWEQGESESAGSASEHDDDAEDVDEDGDGDEEMALTDSGDDADELLTMEAGRTVAPFVEQVSGGHKRSAGKARRARRDLGRR